MQIPSRAQNRSKWFEMWKSKQSSEAFSPGRTNYIQWMNEMAALGEKETTRCETNVINIKSNANWKCRHRGRSMQQQRQEQHTDADTYRDLDTF